MTRVHLKLDRAAGVLDSKEGTTCNTDRGHLRNGDMGLTLLTNANSGRVGFSVTPYLFPPALNAVVVEHQVLASDTALSRKLYNTALQLVGRHTHTHTNKKIKITIKTN